MLVRGLFLEASILLSRQEASMQSPSLKENFASVHECRGFFLVYILRLSWMRLCVCVGILYNLQSCQGSSQFGLLFATAEGSLTCATCIRILRVYRSCSRGLDIWSTTKDLKERWGVLHWSFPFTLHSTFNSINFSFNLHFFFSFSVW